MKRSNYLRCALVLVALISGNTQAGQIRQQTSLPAVYEQNIGQAHASWNYVGRFGNYNLALNSNTFLVRLNGALPASGDKHTEEFEPSSLRSVHTDLLFELVGANSDAEFSGLKENRRRTNYFLSSGDGKKQLHDVRSFGELRAAEVYTDIDAVYKTDNGDFRFDFIVGPQADPNLIRFSIQGANQVSIHPEGHLVLNTPSGKLVQRAPLVYQDSESGRKTIASRYRLEAENTVSVVVDDYDRSKSLVIDPTLQFASIYGGSEIDEVFNHVVDEDGTIVLFGTTRSIDFPVLGAIQPALASANDDLFVTRVDAATGDILSSTYLGGSGTEFARHIAFDNNNDIIITGKTDSPDFPTAAAFDSTYAGGGPDNMDGYVTKISADGASLIYSTYLGGNDVLQSEPFSLRGRESVRGLHVSALNGNTYIVGNTGAPDFPVTHILNNRACMEGETNNAASLVSDVFITVLDEDGQLLSSTCLGGTERDTGRDIVVSGGKILITGHTRSQSFPTTPGTFQTELITQGFATYDIYLARLNHDATVLETSTLIGGTETDFAQALKLDSAGNPVIVGYSYSVDFPVSANAYQQVRDTTNDPDIFTSSITVFSFTPAMDTLRFSTYLGGKFTEYANTLALDSVDRIYLAGSSDSYNYPTTNALQVEKGPDAGDLLESSAPQAVLGNDAAAGHYYLDPQTLEGRTDFVVIATTDITGGSAQNLIVTLDEINAESDSSPFSAEIAISYAVTTATDSGTLNNDNNVDIVFGNCGTASSIHYGDGTGAFPLVGSFASATYCIRHLALNDVNADGLEDIVASDGSTLVYYLNSSNGIFSDAQVIPVAVSEVSSLAVANVTGGGARDLIVGDAAAADQIINFESGTITAVDLPDSEQLVTNFVKAVKLDDLFGTLPGILVGYDNHRMQYYQTNGVDDVLVPTTIGSSDIASTQDAVHAVANQFYFSFIYSPFENFGLAAWETLNNGDRVLNFYNSEFGEAEDLQAFALPKNLGNKETVKAIVVGSLNNQSFPNNYEVTALYRNDATIGKSKLEPNDIVVTVLSPDASSLIYSSYYGGPGLDRAEWGLSITPPGNIYFSGISSSNEVPLVNSYSNVNAGGGDAIIARISIADILDDDEDGIFNDVDNCTAASNPAQQDSDSDGFGNACDGDFNQDGIVNFLDLPLFINNFLVSGDLATDLNSDGITNFLDFAILQDLFFSSPGPGA